MANWTGPKRRLGWFGSAWRAELWRDGARGLREAVVKMKSERK